MVRWLIHESDFEFCASNDLHPFFKNMTKLHTKGFDQPLWVGVHNEAFRAFLTASNVDPKAITADNLVTVAEKLSSEELPQPCLETLVRFWQAQSMRDSKFSLDVLVSDASGVSFQFPWDPWAESCCFDLASLGDSVKALWITLFNEKVFEFLKMRDLTYADLQVFIVVRPLFQTQVKGDLISYSPRSLWDPKVFVVAFQSDRREAAYLIERDSLKLTYYGKNAEALSTPLTSNIKERALSPLEDFQLTDTQIRLLGQFLHDCEKKLEKALRIKWALDIHGRLVILRVAEYKMAPHQRFFDLANNTKSRHLWDHGIINWNPGRVLEPLWFSLLPRNLRIMAIRFAGTMEVKKRLPSDYEKVFRGLMGILRGRPYINMAALHRFLSMGGYEELVSEIEFMVPQWLHRYDREMTESWDSQWPTAPVWNSSEKKELSNKNSYYRKKISKQLKTWQDQMHLLREALSSQHLKTKDVTTLLAQFQTWERKFIPTMIPILAAELNYWNLRSWYYELLDQNSDLPSWSGHYKQEPLNIKGSWLVRRRIEKRYLEMENLREIRPKYLATLSDIWSMLQRFFDLLGQKYQALDLIENSNDIYYLTFEELLAMEEGRAAVIDWKSVSALRKKEYRQYLCDEQVPETWLTKGLIGLASRYPKIISIKENYNPLLATERGARQLVDIPSTLQAENVSHLQASAKERQPLFQLKNRNFTASRVRGVEGLGEIQFIEKEENASESQSTSPTESNADPGPSASEGGSGPI